MIKSLDIFSVPFSFVERPAPVPGELRTQWRLAVILLILFASRQKKASLKKLHVLNWALRSGVDLNVFSSCLQGDESPSCLSIRFEPALIQAINMGRAEKLWDFVGGKGLQLTRKGIDASEALFTDKSSLVNEKAFIEAIRSNMTEGRIESLLSWEGI